jgi:ankyrin repeat protein
MLIGYTDTQFILSMYVSMSIRSNNKTLVKNIKRYIRLGLLEKIDQITSNKTIISILSKRDGSLLIRIMQKYWKYPISLIKYIHLNELFLEGYDANIGINDIIIDMCYTRNLEGVKFLLSDKEIIYKVHIDLSAKNNEAIINAICRGDIEIVKYLLELPDEIRKLHPKSRIDPSVNNNIAFIFACNCGNIEVVKYLLSQKIRELYPNIDPSANDNRAIKVASEYGYLEVVKFLLSDEIRMRFPNIDPSTDDNKALMNAISGNHIEVVKFLLIQLEEMRELYHKAHIDLASPKNLDILRDACYYDKLEVIKFLFSDEIMMLYPSIDPIKLLDNGCYINFSKETLKILLDNKKTIENGGIIRAKRSYRGDKIQEVIREIKDKYSILSI